MSIKLFSLVAFLTVVFAATIDSLPAQPAQNAGEGGLQLHHGDHISIIGNTLADRMQHDGWLETYLYTRFPDHDLVFRNLGFSADEVGPLPTQPKSVAKAKGRIRSDNFGSPDKWLTATKTDVVFAFFGYNESFAGAAGLASFKSELTKFIQHTTTQKYNANSTTRLVLFSPIAHENLRQANLPDGVDNNKRLETYTAAMAEVASANKVPFVDLFHATQEHYAKAKTPLTINGIHLTENGNKLIAQAIDNALFPAAPPKTTKIQLERIRKAVLDKNHNWFNRYRTVDGYSIYGERSKLAFVNGQTNKDVMDREMQILEVMTANLDQVCWAAARGQDAKVDDSNLPAFIPVKTNKAGTLAGGKHAFSDGDDAIKKMTVGTGMKVNLFASEKEFPELVNPVQMAWDTKGRLWVAVWPSYPHWKPGDPLSDKLLVFEDTKGTGKADKCTVFADKLHCPTGFEFYNGGVLLAQAPDLIFLKDTKGTGKADMRVRVLSGLDSADTHHTANSFALDPGGALYFQEGTFHHTQVETPWGPAVRNRNAGVYRYEPRTQKFETYINLGFANPHGHVFDRWGQDIVMDGTNAEPYDAALVSGQTFDMDQRHPTGKLLIYKKKTRPCAGIEILSSRHFPDNMQGDLLVLNVIGFQGILRYKITAKGAGLTGTEMDYVLKSSDPNFRPSDIKIGPDGAIYFTDWHNPLIGHMQHNLRDPSRGHEHGRVYRITFPDRPLLKAKAIAGEPIENLLDALKEPEDRVRYRARIELGGRDSAAVIAAAKKWLDTLDSRDASYEHHLMEALWLHQSHNIVNAELLRRMLRSSDWHARAAATRVLCYWRDRVSGPLELLRVQVNDVHPRVRLEALRALSFFDGDAALTVAFELLEQPTDAQLNFVFNETLNTLERRVNLGGKLNRNNIAASLLDILEKGKLDNDRKAALVETVSRHGTDKELAVIWLRTLNPKQYPPALRLRALEWLAEAASTRRVQPKVPATEVLRLLQDADDALLPSALHLAAAWRVMETAGEFQKIARDAARTQELRFAALDGLAALNDADCLQALRELTGKDQPLGIQFHAAAALSHVNLEEGAKAAAAALARPEQDFDPDLLVQAFLNRKDGSDKLATALEKQAITADTAKRILRSMLLAGRDDAALANIVSRFAKVDAASKLPTPVEIQDLVKEMAAKGDAALGERIFLRPDLGCMKCHAVNKVGGNIGPDLGPIGSSSPVDYIVASVLDPNAAIKEEYATKVITTVTGQIVTGVVVERNNNVVTLKDATGQLVRIAAADIDGEVNGKSLMPDGITRTLTRVEVIDLLRFVSELGKPGPFAVHTPTTVQRWKLLRTVSTALANGIPSRDVVQRDILAKGHDAWEVVYAPMNGKLALADLPHLRQGKAVYLQGEVLVTQTGAVELRVETSASVTVWVDDIVVEQQGQAMLQLATGQHRITIQVEVGAGGAAPTLRVELRKPAGSEARFEVVQID